MNESYESLRKEICKAVGEGKATVQFTCNRSRADIEDVRRLLKNPVVGALLIYPQVNGTNQEVYYLLHDSHLQTRARSALLREWSVPVETLDGAPVTIRGERYRLIRDCGLSDV